MTIAADAFGYVRDLVMRESAIVLDNGKEYLVESRLLPLARQAGAPDVESYIRTLRTQRDPRAQQNVVEALTTNETSFFRDNEPFTALRTKVLPELAATRTNRKLRIWAGACSSGQEPYSIAMTILETPQLTGWPVEILATDLNEEMVARTRKGSYTQLEVNRGLPVTHLVKYFTRNGADWKVNPTLAAMVRTQPLNLVKPFPMLGQFDLIFLRNVLIYFDVPTKRNVLRKLGGALAPDGYLVLGAAETTMGVDDSWERVPLGRSSMYRRRKES